MRSQAVLAAAHAGRLLVSLVTASVLGRSLAPADFAFVALLSGIYIVAVEVLDMGTTAVANREIAAQPAKERETLEALLALRRLVAVAVFAALLGLACSEYVVERELRIVLAIAACGVFLLHLHAYQVVFQVRQAYGRVTALALSSQIGFLLACAVMLKFSAAGAAIGLLVVAREAVQAIGSRWIAVRMLGSRLRARWLDPRIGALLKAGWMIGAAGICYKVSAYAGGFMLWQMSAPESLASFNAAQRLLAPMTDLAWLFVTPLIAALSASLALDPPAFRAQLAGYLKFMLGMSALGAVAGYFLAPFVLRFLYGETYASGPLSAVDPLRWLLLAYLFAVVSPLLVVTELAHGNAKALLLAAAATLALNLSVNTWAIPRYGAEGAAVVLAGCEAFLFAVLLIRCAARGDLGRPRRARV
ncbi:MAG: oligosaccharide flippase family protein [Usitatibacter sp.]